MDDLCAGGVPGGNCTDTISHPTCKGGKLVCPGGSIPLRLCASVGVPIKRDGGEFDRPNILADAPDWEGPPIGLPDLGEAERPDASTDAPDAEVATE